MSNLPPSPDPRVVPPTSRRFHPGLVAALLVAAAVGLGYAGARALALPEPRPVGAAGRLKIDVVQPVEPNIVPGGTMDVGDLENDYRYAPLARETLDTARYEPADEPAWLPAPPPPPRRAPEPEPPPPPPESQPAPTSDRWFGFDSPGRDYRAEREARRARREARDRREFEQDRVRDTDRAREDAEAEERRAWSDIDYPPDSVP